MRSCSGSKKDASCKPSGKRQSDLREKSQSNLRGKMQTFGKKRKNALNNKTVPTTFPSLVALFSISCRTMSIILMLRIPSCYGFVIYRPTDCLVPALPSEFFFADSSMFFSPRTSPFASTILPRPKTMIPRPMTPHTKNRKTLFGFLSSKPQPNHKTLPTNRFHIPHDTGILIPDDTDNTLLN